MTQRVTKPIALDRSFNTTGSNPQNIADVLAENLLAIKEAIENGADTGGAFIVSYGSTTAQQIYDAIREDKVPYLYYNGVVAQLWKVETNKYTFRTTETRVVDSQTYLDIIDYSVIGVTWDTDTKTISGGSGGQTPYFAKASSVSPFDTTGKSGSQEVVYIDDIPEDGIYQVSVLMGITPQIAAASKSDLVFSIVSNSSVRLNNSFHAIVDDSELFAQQVSFSISLTLKAGRNALVLECDDLTTSYLVSVDIMTIASLVNGSSSGGGGGGIATFTVTQTDVNTYTYPDESDVRTAISNYDTVILRLAPIGGGFTNYILDHQAVAVGLGTTYTWVREDGSRVITLEGTGSPTVWTWTAGDTRLKQDISTLDTDIGKIGGSIAPAYSSLTFPIAEGTLCMYARRLYICSVHGGIPTSEEWEPTHWTQIRVSEIIGNVELLLAEL